MKDGQPAILWRVSLAATLTQLDPLGTPLARVYLKVAELVRDNPFHWSPRV